MIEQRLIDQKIRKVLKDRSQKPNIINKIGFYIYIENHLAHLLPIIKHLPKGSVEFITPEINGIPKYFDRTDIPVHSSLDLLADSKKFKCVVSLFMVAPSWFQSLENHFIDGKKKLGSHYFKRLAEKNVRMQYSLGAMPLDLKNYMKSYQSIFVYGPYEEKIYRNLLREKNIYQVGIPKFDNSFSNTMPQIDCLSKLNKKLETILWLPTYDSLSSIPKYLLTMSALTRFYNVILKPHPLESSELIEQVKKTPIILSQFMDSAHYFKWADFVFCDYGGSAFGALYFNKPIVFLSPEKPEIKMNTYSSNSPELLLRQKFLTITEEKPKDIIKILKETDFWIKDANKRSELKSKFFFENPGASGVKAAKILRVKYLN